MKRYRFKQWLYWNLWTKSFRVILWFYPPYCHWHEGGEPEDWENNPPYCPECGKLIWTKRCSRCGKEYLDFSAQGGDDCMGAPTVTSSGDFMCTDCARREEEYEETHDEDGYPYEDEDEEFYSTAQDSDWED